MNMRIVVCIKQVPGSTRVELDPVTKTIIRDARRAVTNPFDAFAIELAIRIKEEREAAGGQVETIALSMGIPATGALLRDAVSRGLDRSVLVTGRAFAGADTLATAYTLAIAIRQLGGADLILCGKMAVDGDTAQTGPELAERLGWPHVTDVSAILDFPADGRSLTVRKKIAGGSQVLRIQLPALITVSANIATPRLPSIAGIRRGLQAPFTSLDAEALAADPTQIGLNGSPTQVVRTYTPERNKQARTICGDANEQVLSLVKLIGEYRP